MRTEYEFSKMKSRRNRYARLLKKPVTIRLGAELTAVVQAKIRAAIKDEGGGSCR